MRKNRVNINKEIYKNQKLIINNLQGKIQYFSESLNHLNDPLTSISGAIELVKRAVNDDKYPKTEHLKIIERSVESLHEILNRTHLLIEESYIENKDVPGNWVDLNSEDSPKVKTILVVDDNDDVLNIMTGMLNKMGHAVMLATNGEQGITIAKMHYFDLIISDINMPKKNGVSFVHKVKTINPWVPILIITGFQTSKTTELINTYKSIGLLNKPFKFDELKSTIEEIFSS